MHTLIIRPELIPAKSINIYIPAIAAGVKSTSIKHIYSFKRSFNIYLKYNVLSRLMLIIALLKSSLNIPILSVISSITRFAISDPTTAPKSITI